VAVTPAPHRPLTPLADRDRRAEGILAVAAMAATMWIIEIVDLVAGDLDANGIRPHELDGLAGIVFAPFLHGGFGHLIANTLPLVILGAVVAVGGLVRVAAVTAVIALVGGLGTWLVAPPGTVHIGASGIVFGYMSYLVARGILSRRLGHLAVGVVVAFVFGGTFVVGLVPEAGVSWQGHFFGAIGGLLAAWLLHRPASRAGGGSWAG
jgi:membrane associated rhomboid family serine protease